MHNQKFIGKKLLQVPTNFLFHKILYPASFQPAIPLSSTCAFLNPFSTYCTARPAAELSPGQPQ